MSTIVRGPDGNIKIYTKGADTVILERLSKTQPYTEATLAHLEVSLTARLRLCLVDSGANEGVCNGRPPNIMYRIPRYS